MVEGAGGAMRHTLAVAGEGKEAQEETGKVLKGNRFAILASESEQVFGRRV